MKLETRNSPHDPGLEQLDSLILAGMIREATESDIPQLQLIRNAIRENRLSDPGLIRDADYAEYFNGRGKGWLCEIDGIVAGFAIVDLAGANVWALFLDPGFEGQGIGRQLHDAMIDWYFSRTGRAIWLGTAPGTRAESFYRKAGWTEAGIEGREIRFEMRHDDWNRSRTAASDR